MSGRYAKWLDEEQKRLGAATYRSPEWNRLLVKRASELRRLIETDDEFAVDAMAYELQNHEYIVTLDPSDALMALGLSEPQVMGDPRLRKLFARAEDRAVGVEGVPVNDETDYFIRVRKSDWSYTAKDAIREYLSGNEAIARDLVNQYAAFDESAYMMDWDGLEEYINSISDKMQVLRLGYFAENLFDSENFIFDGYDNIKGIPDWKMRDHLKSIVDSSEFCDHILDGSIEIPERMAVIVGIFADRSRLSVSKNLKARRTATRKARAGATNPRSKAQSSNRKPSATRSSAVRKSASRPASRTASAARKTMKSPAISPKAKPGGAAKGSARIAARTPARRASSARRRADGVRVRGQGRLREDAGDVHLQGQGDRVHEGEAGGGHKDHGPHL